MSRDHNKLKAFALADRLVEEVYRATVAMPRGAVRPTGADTPLRGFRAALGSASELRYLLGLAARLGFLPGQDATMLDKKSELLLRTMQRLINALERKA